MRAVARLGHWLLPWLAVVSLSGTLAYAADVGVVRTMTAASEHALPTTAEQSPTRWVLVESVGADDITRKVNCLAYVDMVTTDVVQIRAIGLDDFLAETCSSVERW